MTLESNESGATRSVLDRLAAEVLQYYAVNQPPVPVEQMLREPPAGLTGIDPNKVSFVMEHGLYNYAPRLAMARLLCRELTRNGTAKKAFGIDVPQASYAGMKLFARCLLMPPHWMQRLVEQGLSVEQISAYLQVPSHAVVTRLAELGLPVPGAK
jgi:hypothetical protein